MTDCPSISDLEAYHDGELAEARRLDVERHLSACQPCSRELANLRAMSLLLKAMPVMGLSPLALHRLHQQVDGAMERGILRIACTLSSIAASILIIGSVLLLRTNERQTPQSPPPWTGVAVGTDVEPLARDAATPAAAWYLADVSLARADESGENSDN